MSENSVEKLLREMGYRDFRWIKGSEIVVTPWVRLKCQFGCPSYGVSACCPPNTPSVDECVEIFKSYEQVLILRFHKSFDNPEERHQWGAKINKELLELEKRIFCAGFHKTFLLFMSTCAICATCVPKREECKQPLLARPSAEGLAVDVFETVRSTGYEIEVLKNKEEEMNKFAFILVE